MRLVADDGVRSREDRGGFIGVPEGFEVHDVLLNVRRQRIVDETLVVAHLLERLGRDERLVAGLLHPLRDEFAILRRAAFVIGDLLRSGVQRVELLGPRIVHAGVFRRVRADHDGDELLLLQTELLHRREPALVIAHVDAKAAIGTEFGLHARALENAQRLRFTRVDESSGVQQFDALRRAIALHHRWEEGLAEEAVTAAMLSAELHVAEVLAHAGVTNEEIAGFDRALDLQVLLAFAVELALQELDLRKAALQHREDALVHLHRPHDDFQLRQMLLDHAQRARSVADVADVDRVPRGLQHEGLRFAISGKDGPAERSGEGGDEMTARGHDGWLAVTK